MTDGVTLPAVGSGTNQPRVSSQGVTADADAQVQDVALAYVVAGVRTRVNASNPLPISVGTVTVTGGLTDTQLRATPVPVSGTVAVTGTFWQATQPVSGTVSVSGSVAVTGPLTDTQLRATPVPVSGTVTTGGLTDTQLRATAVPVSVPGSVAVTGTFWQATQPVSGTVAVSGSVAVTGPLTDTQIRATPLPVSGTFWQATQPVSLASVPSHAVTNAGTFAVQVTSNIPGVTATSLGKAEDAAHTTGDTGVMSLAVRNDAGTALAANGDYIPLMVNASGALYVTGGGGGTQYVEDTASTGGETMTLAGVVRQDTLASSLSTDGDYGYMKVNNVGSLYTKDSDLATSLARTYVVTDGSSKDHQGVLAEFTTAGVPTAVTSAVGLPVSVLGSVATELATGTTPYSNTALTNTKQQIKASAGKLYGWMLHNPSAATAYIQVWDVASGSITVGTTAPTWTIQLPAGASANVFTDKGVTHATAINIAATTTPTGSTAPGTALVVSFFYT